LGGSAEKFDKLLVETVDEAIKWAFGEYTASLIYEYLTKRTALCTKRLKTGDFLI